DLRRAVGVHQLHARRVPARQAASLRVAGFTGVRVAAGGAGARARSSCRVEAGRPPLSEHRELSKLGESVVVLDNLGKNFTVAIRKGRLRRERREVHAVDGISLAIEAGAMVGYIGPNGAGKSTTIKMLTGILVPSSGSARVAGLDPNKDRVAVARR